MALYVLDSVVFGDLIGMELDRELVSNVWSFTRHTIESSGTPAYLRKGAEPSTFGVIYTELVRRLLDESSYVQFSTRNPGTRPNSRSLLVTRVSPRTNP